MEDYYKTLGVEKSASADEIKKAYRNLAFKYHPDRNPGDKSAEESFKRINEAYSVLGDESKRRQYDLYGSASAQNGYGQYSQNSYSGSYGQGYGTYGRNTYSDPFEEFFRQAYSQRNSSQSQDEDSGYHTYTWTKRNAEDFTRSAGLRMFGRGMAQFALAGLGFFVVKWFFPLNIICIAAAVRGIIDAVRSLKYVFGNNKSKG